MVTSILRVLKETMRTGGFNLTQQPAEDLSLSALFLMEASKKVERDFGVHRSTSHTTRDANSDITKISNYLLEKKVTHEISQRTSPAFSDPAEIGLDKMCNTSWIHDTLARTESDDYLEEDVRHKRWNHRSRL